MKNYLYPVLIIVNLLAFAFGSEPSKFEYMLRGYCYADSGNISFEGYGVSSNLPKEIDKTVNLIKNEVYLLADPDQKTVFAGKFEGMKLKLINGTDANQIFGTCDSRLNIIQQAKDSNGIWKDIEYLPSSWCGNSYYSIVLESKKYWEFSTPRYQGDFKTKLRFLLMLGTKKIYSNEFNGSISLKQFIEKQGYESTNIMDSYSE